MRFTQAIDLYVADMRSQGRMNSDRTEVDYRQVLNRHSEDVSNRDPRLTGREDVKVTLRRWPHPNSQAKNRSILVSFYDYLVEEGMRDTNPARQTRRPKRRKPSVYRLTRDEATAMLNSCRTERERWALHLGLLTGARRAELLGFQGRHFRRPDLVHISTDIAKGGRERWVPVLPELAPVVSEIQRLEDDDYVLCAQRWRDPGVNREKADYRKRPASEQALWNLVLGVGERAGIRHPIRPHLLRHWFAQYVAEQAGDVRIAQLLLGHAEIGTTQTYLGQPPVETLILAVQELRLGLSQQIQGGNPVEAPTRIELVSGVFRPVEPDLSGLDSAVALYLAHFRGLAHA